MTGGAPILFLLAPLLAMTNLAAPISDTPDAITVAMAHIDRGAPELAIEILEPLLAREPENAVASRLLGEALHATGQIEAAAAAHERAAEYPENLAAASFDAARAHALLGHPHESIRWLDRAWQGGFRDLDRLRDDADLASLSGDARYQQLLSRFESSLVPFSHRVRVIHSFEGRAEGEMFGWVGIDAGDVDGDGVHDLAIAAPYARVEGQPAGRVEVRSGGSGKLLFEVWGEAGDQFGTAVGAAGDIDGDGYDDIIIGAPGDEHAMAGRVAVYSGRGGKLLLERTGDRRGDQFGAEARGIDDWDGDGIPDLLVGAPGFDGGDGQDAGRVQLLSGRDLEPFHAIVGERAGDRLGGAAAGAARAGGHFLVIGAGKAGVGRRGRAYLFRGEAATLLATIDADETGGSLGEMFVSIIGDVDADGVLDFSISDWRNRARGKNSGRLIVHSGADGLRILTLTGSYGEGFGIGDAIAGDVDGDGHADLVVGAWLTSRSASGGGSVFLYSGATSEMLVSWNGRTVGDHLGFDATGIGDVDGDGGRDFLITAASSTIRGSDTGRAFVVAGPVFFIRNDRASPSGKEGPEDGDQRPADDPDDEDER